MKLFPTAFILALLSTAALSSGPLFAQGLPEVTVTADRPVPFHALPETLLDTPQTIVVLPTEVLEQQDVADIRDALRDDSSVQLHADEDSAQGTNAYIRGFSARFDTYLDGILDVGNYYRDDFNLNEVDVFTGPSGALFGRGSTGGVIQQVSKTPQMDEFAHAAITIGTDQTKRLTLDYNAPLGATVAFRVNLMAQEAMTAGRDNGQYNRWGIAPSLTAGIGTDTIATLALLHQTEDNLPDYGLPYIYYKGADVATPVPVNGAFYGFSTDYERVGADVVTGTVAHTFDDGGVLRDEARFGQYQRAFRATDPQINPIIDPGAPLSSVVVTRTERGGYSTERILDDQLDYTRQFDTGALSHKIVVGAEIGEQTSDPTIFNYHGTPSTFITPDENAQFAGSATIKSVSKTRDITAAAYAIDHAEIGNFMVDVSARVDRFDESYARLSSPPISLRHIDIAPSYRASLSYKITPDLVAYALFGTSFDPSAEGLSLSPSTADLAPERTKTIEAGVKWDVNEKSMLSAALFRTTMTNLRETDPTDPNFQILAGNARSQGVELHATGKLTDKWSVLAGYTYLDATIVSSPNADVGARLQNSPHHSARAWTTYEPISCVTLGLGAEYNSVRTPGTIGDVPGYIQEVPGYFVANVMAGYRVTDNLSMQVNVDNLLDRKYYDYLDDNHVNPGAGRTVYLKMDWKV